MSIVRDPALAADGQRKISWAGSYMPALRQIGAEFEKTQPFAGKRVALSIHLEAKTANMALTLKKGGAEVFATGCNPLSTQDDVAAGLAEMGVHVYAWHNSNAEEYEDHLCETLKCHPHVVLDDGGDLLNLLHGRMADCGDVLYGTTEETTTGLHRARVRAAEGKLKFPLMAVNDARCKHLFDNRFGTGQSVWDAIMHTTNITIGGATVVIAGYGDCGRGVALRAKGLGANVIITEVDPVCALEALMDGCRVMSMDEAAPLGDIFCTVTGCCKVITGRHMEKMKDGAILCNAGHFDVEVDKDDLNALAVETVKRREGIMGYRMADGRVLNLLAEGRLVNLAAGNGHPVEIMDMSFSVQALALQYLLEHGRSLKPGVYHIPPEIDGKVSAFKLKALGLTIDTLTSEQERYMNTY